MMMGRGFPMTLVIATTLSIWIGSRKAIPRKSMTMLIRQLSRILLVSHLVLRYCYESASGELERHAWFNCGYSGRYPSDYSTLIVHRDRRHGRPQGRIITHDFSTC